MSGWFDDIEKPDNEPVTQETPVVETEETGSTRAPKRPAGRPSPTVMLAVGAATVLVGVIGAAGLYFASLGGDDTTAQPADETVAVTSTLPTTTHPSSTSASPSPTVTEETCPDQAKPTPTTPDGAVVAFQKAYFEGDVDALLDLVDEGSYLQDADWPTVLAPVVGATWCANTEVEGNTVHADVTMTQDLESAMFVQDYTMVKRGNGWLIQEIADRKNPLPTST